MYYSLAQLIIFRLDADNDPGFGGLFNDNHLKPNMILKLVYGHKCPIPAFFANRLITAGEELSCNYGDGKYFWRMKGKLTTMFALFRSIFSCLFIKIK